MSRDLGFEPDSVADRYGLCAVVACVGRLAPRLACDVRRQGCESFNMIAFCSTAPIVAQPALHGIGPGHGQLLMKSPLAPDSSSRWDRVEATYLVNLIRMVKERDDWTVLAWCLHWLSG